MIHAIFFDLDDTLLDFRLAERTAVATILSRHGVKVTEEILARYSAINASYWHKLEEKKVTRDELKVFRYRDLIAEFGFSGLSYQELAMEYESTLSEQGQLVAGAKEILTNLHGKYRLYSASNGSVSVQISRLREAKILDCFDKLFLSEELGVEKPSTAFFDKIFSNLPILKREDCVMVGDRLTSDILCGINSGLKTVWFNPDRAKNTIDIRPTAEIQRLSELETVIKSL